MLAKYLKGASSPIYYIAGPLVTGLDKMLQEAGINEDDIRKEEFTGYRLAVPPENFLGTNRPKQHRWRLL